MRTTQHFDTITRRAPLLLQLLNNFRLNHRLTRNPVPLTKLKKLNNIFKLEPLFRLLIVISKSLSWTWVATNNCHCIALIAVIIFIVRMQFSRTSNVFPIQLMLYFVNQNRDSFVHFVTDNFTVIVRTLFS